MSGLSFSPAHFPFPSRRVALSLFIHGAVCISWQILLIRSVMNAFQGNEILVGFCLCFYLLWIAVGSWFSSHVLSRSGQTPFILVVLFSLSALAMPVTMFVLTILKSYAFISAMTIVSAYQALLITFIICAPFCFFAGAVFPLCIKMLPESANAPIGRISRAYGYESLGSGLGALFVFFLIIPNAQPINAALFLAALLFCAGLVLICSKPFPRAGMVFSGGLICLCFYLGFTDTLHTYQKSLQWPERTWVTGQNTRKGYLEVVCLDKQNSLFLNGSLLAVSDFDATSLKSVRIAMGQSPPPRKVLLVGSRLTGCINEFSPYELTLCDYVNSNALEIEWSETYISPLRSISSERCNIHVSDERGYIRNTSAGQYDLVIINKPSPTSLELNRFYTIEFLQEVSRSLDEHGVMMLIMDASSVDLTLPNLRFLAAVSRTIDNVFPSNIIMPGSPCIFLASRQEKFMLSDRQLEIMHAFSGTINITPRQLAGLIRQQYASIEINSDFRPIGMLINLGRGIHRYVNPLPGLADYAGTQPTQTRILCVVLGVCLFVALCLGVSRTLLFTPFMTFLIGFSSMAYQVIILFFFQILFGDLYYHLGILISLFMAGIALGTLYHSHIRTKSSVFPEQMIISGGLLSFICLPVALIFLSWSAPTPLWFFILSFTCGVINGLVFPVLVSRAGAISGRPDFVNAGGIYAWDNTGASVGALVAAPLMVGLLGGYGSLLFLAGLNGAMLMVYYRIAIFRRMGC